MPKPISQASLTAIVLAFLLAFGTTTWLLRYEPLPDFGALDVPTKKQTFFAYLQPKIDAANETIAKDRLRLQALNADLPTRPPSWRQRRFIAALAADYDIVIDDPADYLAASTALLRRVDIIPPALVLIQAAKESGWGTSKFAVQGNNLFGQQCFVAGCGFVPTARLAGRSHEVARFDSVDEAVAAYLHNLNTHPRYQRLREIRATQRANNEELTGSMLADGLLAYSERGADYVVEVKYMIRQNNLE